MVILLLFIIIGICATVLICVGLARWIIIPHNYDAKDLDQAVIQAELYAERKRWNVLPEFDKINNQVADRTKKSPTELGIYD